MPYCEHCKTSNELMNIEPTQTPNMQQGICTRCLHTVYFFTDISMEAATDSKPLPALKKPTYHPAEQKKPPLPPRLLRVNRRNVLAVAVGVFILIILLIIVVGNAVRTHLPLSATASIDATHLSITNNNSFAWSDVHLILNDTYTCTVPVMTLPSLGTGKFDFSQFTSGNNTFDPTREIPKNIKIRAKDNKGHSGEVVIALKKAGEI